jgi:hypothetical protein
VLVVAVLLGVYIYFVKLVRIELKRLGEQNAQLPPEGSMPFRVEHDSLI